MIKKNNHSTMAHMKFKIVFIILILSILSGCNMLPFVKYYTTTKSGKFPKFSKKEYLAGTNNDYRSCYDVTYYDLDIDVNPDKKYIKGSMAIHFDVKQKTYPTDIFRSGRDRCRQNLPVGGAAVFRSIPVSTAHRT